MRQWDIIMYPFPGAGTHPAVVISSDDICRSERHPSVNALICTTLRAGRSPGPAEVRLNGADGLDWATSVRCDQIFMLAKSSFQERRGTVTTDRRRIVGRRIIESFNLFGS